MLRARRVRTIWSLPERMSNCSLSCGGFCPKEGHPWSENTITVAGIKPVELLLSGESEILCKLRAVKL